MSNLEEDNLDNIKNIGSSSNADNAKDKGNNRLQLMLAYGCKFLVWCWC